MIIIKTLIGITSIIAIAYVLHAVGKLTQRYVLCDEDAADDAVLCILAGMLGIALIAGIMMVFVVAYALGETILRVI